MHWELFRASLTSPLQMLSVYVLSCSIVSTSLQPHGLEPSGLLCPWDFPSNNTEVVAIPFSQGSSQPRDQTCISCIYCTGSWILGKEFPELPGKPTEMLRACPKRICPQTLPNVPQSRTTILEVNAQLGCDRVKSKNQVS